MRSSFSTTSGLRGDAWESLQDCTLSGRARDAREQGELALAAVVDAQHAQPFAAVWGPGSTSSDGVLPAGGRGEAMSDCNARRAPAGLGVLRLLADRFASYYSRIIAAAASDAPYVLDGLMHHESAVEMHEHATDTAGAVESIVALAHAFGYRFAPRIRDLGERKLYVADRDMAEGLPDAVLGGVINRTTIEENWVEVLRLAASIRAGVVPPSVILKKLAAFPARTRCTGRCGRWAGWSVRSLPATGCSTGTQKAQQRQPQQGREPACLGAGRVLPPLG